MTDLIDIYEAAGAKISPDRTYVEMSVEQPLRPFDIVIKVIPMELAWEADGKHQKMTFKVLLHNEFILHEVGSQAYMEEVEYGGEVTIPVSQVRIHREG